MDRGLPALDPLTWAHRNHSHRGVQAWVGARKRHRLSHGQVQMARELGLNPAKLGQLDNRRQEPWKAPLPQFIEDLYANRGRPDVVKTIDEIARPAERHRAEPAAGRASHTPPA
jgi:hypothetical protein